MKLGSHELETPVMVSTLQDHSIPPNPYWIGHKMDFLNFEQALNAACKTMKPVNQSITCVQSRRAVLAVRRGAVGVGLQVPALLRPVGTVPTAGEPGHAARQRPTPVAVCQCPLVARRQQNQHRQHTCGWWHRNDDKPRT